MSFESAYNDAVDVGFLKRVDMALRKVAIAVFADGQGNDSAIVYEKRISFAISVLLSEGHAKMVARAALAPGVLTINGTDNDVEYTVANLFNPFAGVKNGE